VLFRVRLTLAAPLRSPTAAGLVVIALVMSTPSQPQDAPDVRVQVFSSATSLYTGEKVVYTVLVSNVGRGLATDVSATVTFSSAITVVTTSGDHGSRCTVAATVVCQLDSLARNERAKVRLSVRPRFAGMLTLTIAAVSRASDSSPADNSASSTLTVRPGHEGPPTIRASRALRRAITDRRAVVVRGSVASDEGGTVTVHAVDARRHATLSLLKGSRLGPVKGRRARSTISHTIRSAGTLALELRLDSRRLKHGRRYSLLIRVVDLEHQSAAISVPFTTGR